MRLAEHRVARKSDSAIRRYHQGRSGECQDRSLLHNQQERGHPTAFQEIQQRGRLFPPNDGKSRVCGRAGRRERSTSRFLRLHREERHNRQAIGPKGLLLHRGRRGRATRDHRAVLHSFRWQSGDVRRGAARVHAGSHGRLHEELLRSLLTGAGLTRARPACTRIRGGLQSKGLFLSAG